MNSIFADPSKVRAYRFGMYPGDPNTENTIYLRERASLSDHRRIERESYQMVGEVEDGQAPTLSMSVSNTHNLVVHLSVLVTEWEGPIFQGTVYQPDLWGRLDMAECEWWLEPLSDVVAEIMNPKQEPPPPTIVDPKSPVVVNGQPLTATDKSSETGGTAS